MDNRLDVLLTQTHDRRPHHSRRYQTGKGEARRIEFYRLPCGSWEKRGGLVQLTLVNP
jgi:hypothetical protein